MYSPALDEVMIIFFHESLLQEISASSNLMDFWKIETNHISKNNGFVRSTLGQASKGNSSQVFAII